MFKKWVGPENQSHCSIGVGRWFTLVVTREMECTLTLWELTTKFIEGSGLIALSHAGEEHFHLETLLNELQNGSLPGILLSVSLGHGKALAIGGMFALDSGWETDFFRHIFGRRFRGS